MPQNSSKKNTTFVINSKRMSYFGKGRFLFTVS